MFFLSPETQENVLRNHISNTSDPYHGGFPVSFDLGRNNAIRRIKTKKEFKEMVNLICGAQRRKVWKQLKKDYEQLQQHLKVA